MDYRCVRLCALIAICAYSLSACSHIQAAPEIIAPGATLTKVAGDFAFTEGPAADRDGNVYFTDQPNDRIWRWSVDGKLTIYREHAGRANGMCFDRQGNLWVCADEHNQLWKIDRHGKVTVAVADYGGKLLDGPNDVWVRPDGGLYFTDPYYRRDYWTRGPQAQDTQGVYFLSAHGVLKRVAGDLVKPNGIIGTPDGKTLYVADIDAGQTFAYDILPDGSLANKRLFCHLGSDGMTIDSVGNVYLTGNGVTVFDPAGTQIGRISVPEGWTGNVCFGGRGRKTLFVTASHGIYTLQMIVHGVGSQ